MAGNSLSFRNPGRHVLLAVGFLILAVILGGGGSPNPATELWLELLAALTALAWLWIPRPGMPVLPQGKALWLVIALVAVVPIVQLIPLPPSIWTRLPGRETELAALELVGAGDSWQPLTTSVPRTLASLLSLGPPLLVLAMTAALDASGRRWLIGTIAAMALVSAVFGALQLAGGSNGIRMYAASNQFVVTGFQANKNAAADILLIGVLALAALMFASDAKHRARWLLAASLVLLAATVFTASRMGIVLIPVALFGCLIIVSNGSSTRRRGPLLAICGGGLALAAAGLVLLQGNPRLQAVAERFSLGNDARETLWTDSLFVIGQYWPFGSGMGTFVPSFIAAEPLEAVDPSVPNRAHNDFLELAIEAGAAGIAALIAVVLLVAFMAVRAWRSRPEDRPQVLFGLSALAIVALHSVVDYPLRSMALACFAAVAAGMFAAPPLPRPEDST